MHKTNMISGITINTNKLHTTTNITKQHHRLEKAVQP